MSQNDLVSSHSAVPSYLHISEETSRSQCFHIFFLVENAAEQNVVANRTWKSPQLSNEEKKKEGEDIGWTKKK